MKIVANGHAAEFRAFWVDAFNNPLCTPSDVDNLLAKVREVNANAIVVQLRKRGDAYYISDYEPTAVGVQEGFDPLNYLLDRAHNGLPYIEVHAWMCAFPIWNKETELPESPYHPFNRLPHEWFSADTDGCVWEGGSYWYDPGHPEAMQYTVDVYMNLLSRYDVDGIHSDRIRYAEGEIDEPGRWGYSSESLRRFRKHYGYPDDYVPSSTDEKWSQWRRDQVSAFQRKVYANAVALRPGIKVSASTIVWGHGPASEEEWSKTSPYSRVFQDWRSWMEEGILDLNVPMAYFKAHVPEQVAMWESWSKWCKDHKYGRHLAMGLGIYMNGIEGSIGQLRSTRVSTDAGNDADGVCFYSFGNTNRLAPEYSEQGADEDFFRALWDSQATPDPAFGSPVKTRPMPWKESPDTGIIKGTVVEFTGQADGAKIEIKGPVSRTLICDGTGFYAAAKLQPGIYKVTCSIPGLASQTSRIGVPAGTPVTQNFLYAPPGSLVADTAAELSALSDGTRVVLRGRKVTAVSRENKTVTTSGSGGEVVLQFTEDDLLLFAPGEVLAVYGKLRRDSGTKVLENPAVCKTGYTLVP